MTQSFTDIINSVGVGNDESSYKAEITQSWMQGRTTYGGLSAAICLAAVTKSFPDLPPLRSAQINFIGPVGGEVNIETKVLRQGRSVAYVSAEMFGEKGLATSAVFCFGAARDSKLNDDFIDTPNVPSVEESEDFFKQKQGPGFTSHFDCLSAKGGFPASGSAESEHFIWVRHKDKSATDLAALIGIADMPPPAVLPMFTEFAPISSMTWMFNIMNNNTATEDGWWLMRTAAEYAHQGYSSQDMQIWNRAGELVLTGRQNVAIFY